LIYDGVSDNPYDVNGRTTLQDSEFRVSLPTGNITADPTNASHLAVCWFDTRNGLATNSNPYLTTTNSDIIVSQSYDGGATWSTPTALAIPNDQFMPWAAYDATGHLQIGFFDRSYDPANHAYGYTLASETSPGSLSFTYQEVSTALSDPTKNDAWFRTTQNAAFPHATTFLGDYSNIAITPNGVAAFWTDMRDTATFPGRVGLFTEESFFGDPHTGASATGLAGAVTPGVSRSAGTVASQTSRDNLDGFYAGLVNSLQSGSSSTQMSSSSSDSPSPAFLAHLEAVFGFDWLDDSAANPLE
jgi:hypothetical protein